MNSESGTNGSSAGSTYSGKANSVGSQLGKGPEALIAALSAKLPELFIRSRINLGDVELDVPKDKLLDLVRLLRLDAELQFNYLVSITAVDWLDSKDQRFEVIYHLLSIPFSRKLRLRVALPEEDPKVDSIVPVWPGANFMEREVWDMFGITFANHPDLRRILMYDEFVGHPLRKDYPLQGKQPRVPLRHPEVSNTARDMLRAGLVQIGSARPKVAAPRNSGHDSQHGSSA